MGEALKLSNSWLNGLQTEEDGKLQFPLLSSTASLAPLHATTRSHRLAPESLSEVVLQLSPEKMDCGEE